MSSSDPTQPADDAAARRRGPRLPAGRVGPRGRAPRDLQDARETVEVDPFAWLASSCSVLRARARGRGRRVLRELTRGGPLGVASPSASPTSCCSPRSGPPQPRGRSAPFAGRTWWVEIAVLPAQLAGACLAVTTPTSLRTVPTVTPDIADRSSRARRTALGLSPFVASRAVLQPARCAARRVIVTHLRGRRARARAQRALAPAAGLAYAVIRRAPVTNGGLNPARSTATAIFAGGEAVAQLWVFWAAPLLGAAIAGLLHAAHAARGRRAEGGPETDSTGPRARAQAVAPHAEPSRRRLQADGRSTASASPEAQQDRDCRRRVTGPRTRRTREHEPQHRTAHRDRRGPRHLRLSRSRGSRRHSRGPRGARTTQTTTVPTGDVVGSRLPRPAPYRPCVAPVTRRLSARSAACP